jgi:hypothetical protein
MGTSMESLPTIDKIGKMNNKILTNKNIKKVHDRQQEMILK